MKMRQTDHVARIRNKRKTHKAWAGKPEDNDPLDDLHRDGILLKWFLKKTEWGRLIGSSSSRWGQVTGCCECGNEPSSSVQFGCISCLAGKISDPQEQLYSMQTVTSVNCMNVTLRTLNYSSQTPTVNIPHKHTSPNLATKK
jgi:hypothetical protein